MRILVSMLVVLSLATGAHASDFKPVKTLKNAKLQALSEAMDKFEGRFVRSGAYTVTRKTDLNGRTEKERRKAILKETLHRYSGASLDEGIDIRTAASAAEAVSTVNDAGQDDSQPWKPFEKAMGPAFADKSLEIYAGTGSGNNTMASMVCVYDKTNDQVVYIIFSNFGSDD